MTRRAAADASLVDSTVTMPALGASREAAGTAIIRLHLAIYFLPLRGESD